MRHPATRFAIHASLGWLVLWMAGSLTAFLFPETAGSALLLSRVWQVLLPAFGFLGIMIFAMSYHFVPVFSGRSLGLPRLATGQLLAANGAVGLLILASFLPLPGLQTLGYALWLGSAMAFLGVLRTTFRRPRRRAPPSAPAPAVDRRALPLTMAAPLYLLASAAVLFLGSLPVPCPLSFASGLHLYTAGFVALMVFGVGLHLFPRFAGSAPSPRLARLLQATALPAPAGLSLFLNGPAPLLAAFAFLFAVAAATFLALLVQVWQRAARRRPFYRFNLAAACLLQVGVAFGVAFALVPATRLWTPTHGLVNLFGFAGLMVLGVTHEVMPPYASRGYATSLRVGDLHLLGALAGLGLAAGGRLLAAAGGPVAAAGHVLLLAVVLSYAVGTLWTLRSVPTAHATPR